jgi:uncharacterized membrane protein YgdD (TMEM256/DUF423 family)
MKLFIAFGSILGLLAVAAGAFGAHALEGRLDAHMLDVWDTAAKYQIYHALALFAAAWLVGQTASTWASAAGWSFFAGTLVFSGTLYILAASGIKWLGAITPIGGLALMAGWFCCFMAALKLN